jgi:hypothetical protein
MKQKGKGLIMIRKHGMALLGMALLAAISAVPARAHANLADAFVVQDRAVTASAVDDNQAASSCEHDGGWYDAAAGVCDSVGE